MLQSILLFITGLALFMVGMLKLSNEMQNLFSAGIREQIRFSVKKPFYGLIMGLLATVVFQSSSATTLLTIGIVSAGLISFYQSLGIILGADIGTTLTIQLVVWKVTTISPVIIFIGVVTYFLARERRKAIGEAIIYFGLIFYGLNLIAEATGPLKNHPFLIAFFIEKQHPLMGLLTGIASAALIHASAVPISIVTILGQQGLISIENALPIVLGANIGTTATAILGSTVTNISGRRSAIAHLLFKCIGVLICFIFLPVFTAMLKNLSSNIAQQVAYSHFLSNVFIVLIFIFFLKPFAKVVERIIPGREEVLPLWPEYLDAKCLVNAEDALACVKKELSREIMLAEKMVRQSLDLFTSFAESKKRDIMYMELIIDNLQAEITKFLWSISCGELTPKLSKRLFAFSSIVYDIERVGDHAINLVELAEQKDKRKAHFTEPARKELKNISDLVIANLEDTASLIEEKDIIKIRNVFERERSVDIKIKAEIEKHLERFYRRACVAEAGPIYVDTLVNIERISDHCQLIAELVNGLDEE